MCWKVFSYNLNPLVVRKLTAAVQEMDFAIEISLLRTFARTPVKYTLLTIQIHFISKCNKIH